MDQYIQVICDLSIKTIKDHPQDECKIPATEFWNCLASEELKRVQDVKKRVGVCDKDKKISKNYLGGLINQILPPILLNLRKVEADNITGNNLSVFNTSSLCLSTIYELLGDQVEQITTDFIVNFIGNEDWKDKVAS